MTQPPPGFEARLAAVEARLDLVAADAAAARHLAAARDRDIADLGVKVDANRSAINALGEQAAAGFAEMRARLDRHDEAFTEMRAGLDRHDEAFTGIRGRLDQTAAGVERIGDLLSTLIDREGGRPQGDG